KSTIGNMLLKACGNHNELFEKYKGPYDGHGGDGRNQQQLKTAKLSIGEENFILVDTPGFTNEKTSTNRTWIEIDKAIDNSFEHGIQGRRFASDRRSHLDECMKKLNNENVIIVFTKCTKVQTEAPKNIEDSFANFINEYIAIDGLLHQTLIFMMNIML
ncbi:4530_t:CDS:2, partial [Racocetra persica]